MNKRRRFIKQWLFLLVVIGGICIRGKSVNAKELPVLVPDGEYVTSTVTENEHADYSCSFKLVIEKAGYYYFKEKTANDDWWTVKRELNAHSWWYGQSVWYLEEGTYYIGPETFSGDGYPCVRVFSAECEFDLSKVQASFETTNLVYESYDIVKQWMDNASVKVSLSSGTSFTTSLEGVWLRPVLYKNGKAVYAIGSTDFDKDEYVVGGDYEVRVMNYVESYCEYSKNIKVKTCSFDNIPETNFDKDMKLNKKDKFSVNVEKSTYILIKNAAPVFVDSSGNVLNAKYIEYEESIDTEEDSYNEYSYVYISEPQKIYMQAKADNDNVAFYQMQGSIVKIKDVQSDKCYDEFLYDRLCDTVSCYDIKFESDSGKTIQYNASKSFGSGNITIDEKKWDDYYDYTADKTRIPAGKHDFSLSVLNGTVFLNFKFESLGSITEDDKVEVIKDKGEILTEKGKVRYIKIQRDNDGKYVLFNPDKINEDLEWLRTYGSSDMKVNCVKVFEEYHNKYFYIEIDNTSGDYSKLVFAQLLDEKLTALPSETQNITGSETAAWLKDTLDKDVALTLSTTMGDYKVDYKKWKYYTELVESQYGYSVSEDVVLKHGDKFNYVIYGYDYDYEEDENIIVKKITITINNPSYKPSQQSEQNSNTNTKDNKQPSSNQLQQDNSSTSGQTVQIAESSYKITNNTSGKTTISYQAPKDTNKKSYSIPETVTLADGTVAKVTEVSPNAFVKCKKLNKVIIGKNVEKVGKNAFKGCKNLKNIIIKSSKLKKNSFGKNAFKGINKKATFNLPKKQFKNYKKWIKKAGVPKTVKFKK